MWLGATPPTHRPRVNNVDIKTFKKIATQLPPDISILMRGPTGVGKSFLAKAVADELGRPFIDVRGATMDESKVTGIPDFETSKEKGVATFVLPSWFVRSCREPVVLMLDELNRSMPQVMQAFFQVVLDRELGNDADGNPMRLHPDTRVFAAVNWGNEYDVNDMDPALLRRFWTIDLEPTNHDWIDWAIEEDLDNVLIDFIRQNPAHLRVEVGSVEPGTVLPTPASWHRLNDSLVHMGMAPAKIAGNDDMILYSVARGFVGTEAAIAFKEFVANYESIVSAEDILERWDDVSENVTAMNAEGKAALVEKLAEHCSDNKWSAKQAKGLLAFTGILSDEMLVHAWNKVLATNNIPNIQRVHKLLGKRVLEAVKASRDLEKD